MSTLRLSAAVAEALQRAAERAWPEECCGALLADASSVVRERPVANAAEDRRRAFQLSARDYLAVEAEAEGAGLTLVGFYHSHPDGPPVPSLADAVAGRAAPWTVIIPVEAGAAAPPRAFTFDERTRTFHEASLHHG